MSKAMMGWGAVVVAILIAATEYWGLPGSWNYLWSLLVLIWGLKAFK